MMRYVVRCYLCFKRKKVNEVIDYRKIKDFSSKDIIGDIKEEQIKTTICEWKGPSFLHPTYQPSSYDIRFYNRQGKLDSMYMINKSYPQYIKYYFDEKVNDKFLSQRSTDGLFGYVVTSKVKKGIFQTKSYYKESKDSEAMIQGTTDFYTNNHNVIDSVDLHNGLKNQWHYNEDGLVSKIDIINSAENTYLKVFYYNYLDFDQNNNWIKRQVYFVVQDSKLEVSLHSVKLEARSLKYYD